jgi:hypothetical protein
MINILQKCAFIAALISLAFSSSAASEKAVFTGNILGIDGNPVEGAEIFMYNTPETRRPADYISSRTESDGRFRITVAAGKYWVVARTRSRQDYGPLAIGDKHSGEPLEVEIHGGKESEQDFTVMDIREAARMVKKTSEDFLKLTGKAVDRMGRPVKDVYIFANRERALNGFPDYISPWTGGDGEYTLYLPPGKYYIGYSSEFPSGLKYRITMELKMDSDRPGINMNTEPIGKTSR